VDDAVRIADSARKNSSPVESRQFISFLAHLALRAGKLREREALIAPLTPPGDPATRRLGEVILQMALRGATTAMVARMDSAVAAVPFNALPLTDRPYFVAAVGLARAGKMQQANAMMARYRSEATDTAFRREREADMHSALGEIALAAGKGAEAADEFRKGDVGYDGLPANECNFCLPLNLGRAYAATGQADSAIANLERYLATPNWRKWQPAADPMNTPAAHERLGQLYEEKGNAAKAAEHYQAFVEMWKNADADLQPRVAAARERLRKLTPVEGKKE
jgi:tetratricopeptide (TPR) repeat protein